MNTLIAIVLIIIFLVISSIHFYWAFGSKKWANMAVPTKADNSVLVFKPRPIETAIVAISFIGFIAIVAARVGFMNLPVFQDYVNIAVWILATIFIIRAIGEFRYVGFFKKIKDTTFGKMDTKYYSPLCLAIGIMLLLINILKH